MSRALLAGALMGCFALSGPVLAQQYRPSGTEIKVAKVEKKKARKSNKKRKAKKAKVKKKSTRRAALTSLDAYKEKYNKNNVILMSGLDATGAYTSFGADIKEMIRMIGDKSGLRVLPMLGGGAATNLHDILYLRGIDMAIINTDAIESSKHKPLYKDLFKRVHYMTKLFNEEVHMFGGPAIASMRDLDGKRVGFNDSNAEVTGAILFEKLGITPSQTIRVSGGDGAFAMKNGKLDAMIRVTGKPLRNLKHLSDIYPEIRLLPVAFEPAFLGSHLPTELTHDDYPGLIKPGEVVPTVATRTILAVFNWPQKSQRYRRLSKFTTLFFDNFAKLRQSKNLHPKWREVNLEAVVPGLTRFVPAKEWLKAQSRLVKQNDEKLVNNFKSFLDSRRAQGAKKSAPDNEQVIKDFMRWQKEKKAQ